MITPILAANHVSFCYHQDAAAISEINLTIPQGARVAFLGPNGAGKSTLLLLFNGILRPTSGMMQFAGENYVYSKKGLTELRQKIGFVFQDHDSQLFAGTVLDDVIFGPMNLGMTLKQAEQRAKAVLEEVHMEEYLNSPIHFLSHGQKKRVAIAGVLAMNPEVVLMDEPTAGLDYAGMQDLSNIMEKLHECGKTLVVSTHDVEWVWSWADVVFVLNRGRLIVKGAPEEILIRHDHQQLGYGKSIIGALYSFLQHRNLECNLARPRTADELIFLLGEKL